MLTENLQKLNSMQQQATKYFDSPLLILAGAGSGKTTVIVNKIAYLLQNSQNEEFQNSILFNIKPWEILAITFTNKAANELCNRLNLILGTSSSLINAGTFHSQCIKILIKHIENLNYSSNFTIYDTQDCVRLLKKDVFEKLKINSKMFDPKTVLYEISKAKNKFLNPDEFANQNKDNFYKFEISKIYKTYQTFLQNANAVDFDDIIFLTVKLFKQCEDVLDFYQNKFKYVLVDEYQDTNSVQFELIKLLTLKNSNLCVVGDDDQSIYKFRGAAVENILNFEKHLKNVKIIRLEQNYRSTQNILNAANKLIANNSYRKQKTIWTDNGDGEKIEQVQVSNENEEAKFICSRIEENLKKGFKFSDHAIFYRMNAQSATMERFLVRHSIPYQIVGAKKFFDLKEIKDILAYFTVINNVDDNLRLLRIVNEPKRGLGSSTLEKIQNIAMIHNKSIYKIMELAANFEELNSKLSQINKFCSLIQFLKNRVDQVSLPVFFDELLQHTSYLKTLEGDERFEQRLENLKEFKTTLIQFEQENEKAKLTDFLNEIALYTDLNELDSNSDRVCLMTLHSAKGLEFPIVFMIGMEDGIFPSSQSISNQSDLEEERRLAYVGITRAKQKLCLVHASQRLIFGTTKMCKPSRFLYEIPDNLKQIKFNSFLNVSQPVSNQDKNFKVDFKSVIAKPVKQPINFDVFDKVKHPFFGIGKVISITPMGNDNLIEIEFEKVGKKNVMANYAKLVKI